MANFSLGELVNEGGKKNKSEFKNKIDQTNQTTEKNIVNILNRDSTIEREERPLKDDSGFSGINKKNYGELITRNLYHVIFSDIEIKMFKQESKKLHFNNPQNVKTFMKDILQCLKNHEEDMNIAKKIEIKKKSNPETIKYFHKIENSLKEKIDAIKEIIHKVDKSYEEYKKSLESSEVKIGEHFLGKIKDLNINKGLLTINFKNKYIGGLLLKNTLEGQKNEKIDTSRISKEIQVKITGIEKKGSTFFYHLKETPIIIKKEGEKEGENQSSIEKKLENQSSIEKESKPLIKKIIDYITSKQNSPKYPKPYIGISLDELYDKYKNEISSNENITDEKKIRAKIHSILESYIKKNPEIMKKEYFLPEGTHKNKKGNWEVPEGKKALLYYTIITKAIKKNKSP